MSADEDDRDFQGIEQVVYGLQPRAAIGELDIGQDQAGPTLFHQRRRLRPGAGNPDGAVAEIFDKLLKIERDHTISSSMIRTSVAI